MIRGGIVFIALVLVVLRSWNSEAKTKGNKLQTPYKQWLTAAELFTTTNLWNVHLRFSAEQWEAMEPKQQGFGPFGGPGGRGNDGPPRGGGGGRPGEDRGPFGRRGGPPDGGGFGPAMFLAPAFLKGDQNSDQKLSKAEFQSLANQWFSDWDKEKSGRLSADQLRAGLNSTFEGGGRGGPGRPRGGGPGGRGFGMNLQGAEGTRNGLASAAGIEFNYVRADLDFQGQVFKSVAVRYKGNGTFMQSRGSLKRSLKIDLNRFNKGQRIAGISRLNLHNGVTDPSWMNEVLSHHLFRDANVPAPRTAYARVYVTVPGKFDREYLGLYSLVEDVDAEFAQDRYGTKKGAIFKPVTMDLFADLGDEWSKYRQTFDPKTELTAAQSQRLIDFCKFLAHSDDAQFATRIGEYLDLDEFARFMAVTVWLSTMDSILGLGQNFYVYLTPDTQKLQFIPWDLDHSFGQFPMRGTQEQREQLSVRHPWQGSNRFLDRVFQVPAFYQLYQAHLQEFNRTLFQPSRFEQQVDTLAAILRPAVREESAEKLERFESVVSGQAVEPAGFGGPGRGGPGGGGFFQPPKPIKGFVKVRNESVTDQLSGKSEGLNMEEGGFGGGRPGEGPGERGGRGGRGGFGPGNFLGDAFMAALDSDKDQQITHEEFIRGFDAWFERWNIDKSGFLSEDQLRRGINQDLAPFRGGPGGPRD